MQTCIVCMEEGVLLRNICKCKVGIHEECLKRWVTISNSFICRVCNTPYTCVRTTETKTTLVTSKTWVAIVFCVCLFSTIGFLIWHLINYYDLRSHSIVSVILVMTICTGILGIHVFGCSGYVQTIRNVNLIGIED